MEKMDAYSLMDTKIMDRIMKELWNSDIDVSGRFWDLSTLFTIWSKPEDENYYRFYRTLQPTKFKTHSYIIRVWAENIGYRYNIEMFVYIVISIFIQLAFVNYCSHFNEFKQTVIDFE